MRIIFMGTPDFSVPTLSELVGAGHDIVAVYSQPPRRAGRGMNERKAPVHAFADAAGLTVRTPTSLRTQDAWDAFSNLSADLAVVVAYGLLLPREILEAPRHGCFNLHASALPRWRGAAPIHRAIMAGDKETAVMVMRMEEGLDTGPVCLAERVPIGPDTTTGELHDELSQLGGSLMVRAIAALERGSLTQTPQPEERVTYAAKIDKAEARINFSRTAADVHNLIRGLSPFPGAWFEIPAEAGEGRAKGGERVKVLRSTLVPEASGPAGTVLDQTCTIACADGAIRLVEVQRAGKKPCSVDDFLRGLPLAPGTVIA